MTIAALCAALLLLAACGSDPTPRFAPSDPAPTSPGTALATTPGTTIGPPALPRAARNHTKAGAIAFVKYYWNVANYAQQSLDVAPLKALQDGHCNECIGVEQFIARTSRAAGTIRGGDTRVTAATARPVEAATGQWFLVKVHMKANPQVVDLPGSRHDRTYPGGTTTARFIVKPTAHGWLVDFLNVT